MATLIEAEPFLQQEVAPGDWMFQFGRGEIGTVCGVAYVYRENTRYTRYNVIEQDGKPIFEKISERPLTSEELRHFRRQIKVRQHLSGNLSVPGII